MHRIIHNKGIDAAEAMILYSIDMDHLNNHVLTFINPSIHVEHHYPQVDERPGNSSFPVFHRHNNKHILQIIRSS